MFMTHPSTDALPRLTGRTIRLAGCLSLLMAVVLGTSVAAGQDKKDDSDDKKPKIPAPEELTLTTVDQVQLTITYYPSNKGKDAIPVILLHEWKRSRSDYAALAPYLQRLGHAVIVPDLRGHGDSKTRTGGRDIEAAKLTTKDFASIVPADMEVIREFLIAKNNAGS